MNKLSVNLIKGVPAQVEFNVDELKRNLEVVLQQYENVAVTREDVITAKKLLADIRRGQKDLDNFRKKVKNELSEPIKEFEAQCQQLSEMFKLVIQPLDEQIKEITSIEKEEKRKDVEELIKSVQVMFNCDEKLELKKEYLNKSMGMRNIKDDLELQVKAIKERENYNLLRISAINDKCSKYGADPSSYYKLLKYEELENIFSIIESDNTATKVEYKSDDIFSKINLEEPTTVHTISVTCSTEEYNHIINYIKLMGVEVI